MVLAVPCDRMGGGMDTSWPEAFPVRFRCVLTGIYAALRFLTEPEMDSVLWGGGMDTPLPKGRGYFSWPGQVYLGVGVGVEN